MQVLAVVRRAILFGHKRHRGRTTDILRLGAPRADDTRLAGGGGAGEEMLFQPISEQSVCSHLLSRCCCCCCCCGSTKNVRAYKKYKKTQWVAYTNERGSERARENSTVKIYRYLHIRIMRVHKRSQLGRGLRGDLPSPTTIFISQRIRAGWVQFKNRVVHVYDRGEGL